MSWQSPAAASSRSVLARSGSYFRLLLRWWWLFALAALVAAGVALVLSMREPVTYTAKARLLVGPGVDSMDPTINDLRTSAQLMEVYAELAMTRPVLQEVAKELKLKSAGALSGAVQAKTNSETLILTIQAEADEADQAVRIANAVADRLIALSPAGPRGTQTVVQNELRRQVAEVEALASEGQERIRQLAAERQLATDLARQRLILTELGEERDRLNETHKTLANLMASQTGNQTSRIQFVEPAIRASKEEAPLRMNLMLALLAALILAALVVVVVELVDDRLRGPADLSDSGLPMLGAVAAMASQDAAPPELVVVARPASDMAEHYRLMGSRLLARGGAGSRVLLVAGVEAGRGRGGAEVAANLAMVLAQAGQAVVLVDADLHQPGVAPLFGLGDTPGLAQRLAAGAGEAPMALAEAAPGLRVLPAGRLAAEGPFELLASPRMAALVAQLKATADTVLMVTAPLLSFADGLVLARSADSVLVVAEEGRTRHGALAEVMARLSELGSATVGVVLVQPASRSGGPLRWLRRRSWRLVRKADRPVPNSPAAGTAGAGRAAQARQGKATP